MIQFEFRKINAEGAPNVDSTTGKTTQSCTVVIAVMGLPNGEELLTKPVTFEVDNTLSIIDAWINISTVQAPEWVLTNYPNDQTA